MYIGVIHLMTFSKDNLFSLKYERLSPLARDNSTKDTVLMGFS